MEGSGSRPGTPPSALGESSGVHGRAPNGPPGIVLWKCRDGFRLVVEGSVDESREDVGEPAVFVASNGPYVLTGVELKDAELGKGANSNRLTLCRCGQSKKNRSATGLTGMASSTRTIDPAFYPGTPVPSTSSAPRS